MQLISQTVIYKNHITFLLVSIPSLPPQEKPRHNVVGSEPRFPLYGKASTYYRSKMNFTPSLQLQLAAEQDISPFVLSIKREIKNN